VCTRCRSKRAPRELALSDPLRSLEASFTMSEASVVDVQLLADYLPEKSMKVSCAAGPASASTAN